MTKEEEYLKDIGDQVDYYGEESLTENQQALYRGNITYQQYEELEGNI